MRIVPGDIPRRPELSPGTGPEPHNADATEVTENTENTKGDSTETRGRGEG